MKKSVFCGVIFSFFGLSIIQNTSAKSVYSPHTHGHLELNIAIEGKDILVELIGPTDSLLGFEHHPRTKVEKQVYLQVINKLNNGVVKFPSENGCKLSEKNIDLFSLKSEKVTGKGLPSTNSQNGEPTHIVGGKNITRQKHHTHSPNETKTHSSGTGPEHADMRVSYKYQCKNPYAVREASVLLFEHFPKTLKKLSVNTVTEDTQKQEQLSVQNKLTRLSW